MISTAQYLPRCELSNGLSNFSNMGAAFVSGSEPPMGFIYVAFAAVGLASVSAAWMGTRDRHTAVQWTDNAAYDDGKPNTD